MHSFFRVIRYSPKIVRRTTQYFVFTLLGVIFGAFNLVLAIPMLSVLFISKNSTLVVPPLPSFEFSVQFIEQYFNHYFYTYIVTEGPMSGLSFICVMLMICVVFANTFRYLERVIATKMRTDLVRNLRLDLFDKVTRFHIGFFNNEKRGDLISRFTNDIQNVESGILESLKALFKEPITIIVYFIILFFISVKLTLFTLISLPIAGALVAEVIKRLKRQAIWGQESLGRIINILHETFSGMRVIKAFNARGFINKKMEEESDYYRQVSRGMSYKNELAAPMSEFLGVTIMVGVLYFGGSMVLNEQDNLKPEQFIGFMAIFASIIQPLKNFSGGITSMQRALVSAERIFSMMDTPPLIHNKPNAQPKKSFEQGIEYKQIYFAYNANTWVLKNVSLSLPKGKTIALVGASGSGKSTLADLLPRFYDPQQGVILLDGHDIREYDLDDVRGLLGVVTQESILFHDTIFNNIAFGMQHATLEHVIEAAKVANAHDFIMQTEKGYDTVIGERGANLSGGQRQRLSIARAVLKNPPILILDEATSALDSESEKAVQDALYNVMKNRTSLVIAHRLSTIQKADAIVVFQEGTIVEQGTHEELLARKGVYFKLSTIQQADA